MQQHSRVIAVGDIHGRYDLLRKLVEQEICFNPTQDLLIFLGDYIDRGFDSAKVIRYLRELKNQYMEKIVLLAGNHEKMAYAYLNSHQISDQRERIYFWESWCANGGELTLESFRDDDVPLPELSQFINDLKLFYEMDSHIFMHAGIPPGKTLETVSDHEILWNREFTYQGKPLVVGHTIHREVTFYPSITEVDIGAFKSGKLSAFDVVNGKIYTASKTK